MWYQFFAFCEARKFGNQRVSFFDVELKEKKTLTLNLPDWVSVEAWDGYLEMRLKIKRPLTKRAGEMALRRLDQLRQKGWDPSMVLDQSTFMCWQGLYPLKADYDSEKADVKTFDAMRRDASVAAIRRTVESYNQMGRNLHGASPQRNKRIGDGGVH